jgi:hypothetical protein
MAASVVPALIDALVSTATSALPSALVTDGVGNTDTAGDYLMVGVSDPDLYGTGSGMQAATAQQNQMAFGATRPRMEQGEIFLAARSVNGDANQKAARDAVYAMQEALATALRTATDLGVTGVMQLSNGANLLLEQDQMDYGAVATLTYSIAFTAQI